MGFTTQIGTIIGNFLCSVLLINATQTGHKNFGNRTNFDIFTLIECYAAWIGSKNDLVGCPETSATTNQRSVTSQKGEDVVFACGSDAQNKILFPSVNKA